LSFAFQDLRSIYLFDGATWREEDAEATAEVVAAEGTTPEDMEVLVEAEASATLKDSEVEVAATEVTGGAEVDAETTEAAGTAGAAVEGESGGKVVFGLVILKRGKEFRFATGPFLNTDFWPRNTRSQVCEIHTIYHLMFITHSISSYKPPNTYTKDIQHFLYILRTRGARKKLGSSLTLP